MQIRQTMWSDNDHDNEKLEKKLIITKIEKKFKIIKTEKNLKNKN